VEQHTIAYNPKKDRMLLGFLIFLAAAAMLFWLAWTNERGLILYHLIRFGETGATIFYACGAVFTLAMSVFFLLNLFLAEQELTLTANSLTVPAGVLSSKDKTVNFNDIRKLRAWKVNGQTFLEIRTSRDKVRIVKDNLPDENSFLSIAQFLQEKSGVAVS
jgi:hypothetical protein